VGTTDYGYYGVGNDSFFFFFFSSRLFLNVYFCILRDILDG